MCVGIYVCVCVYGGGCGGEGGEGQAWVYHFSDLLENFICNVTNHCYHSNKDAVSDDRVQVLSMQQRY